MKTPRTETRYLPHFFEWRLCTVPFYRGAVYVREPYATHSIVAARFIRIFGFRVVVW